MGASTSEVRPESRLRRTLAPLRASDGFRNYFLAQATSNIGTRMQMAGTAWLVLEVTGSSTRMGVVLAVEVLPLVLLAPLAGRYVDRGSARRTAVVTQVLLAAAVLGLAVAGWRESFTGIVVLSALFGVVAAFDGVARQVLVVEMVPRDALQSALSLNAVSANGSAFVGPAVAGVLIAALGAPWCFVVNALTFLLVARILTTRGVVDSAAAGREAPAPTDVAPDAEPPDAEPAGVVSALRDRAVALPLLAVALVSALTYEFPITLPLLVTSVYEEGAVSYGLLMTASGVGAVLGGLKLAGDRPDSPYALPVAALGLGACVALTALTTSLATGLLALAATGAFSTQFLAVAGARVFSDLAPGLRGRVSGLWQVAATGTTLVGAPLVGAIADAAGVRWALWVGAAAAVAGALVTLPARPRTTTPPAPTRRDED